MTFAPSPTRKKKGRPPETTVYNPRTGGLMVLGGMHPASPLGKLHKHQEIAPSSLLLDTGDYLETISPLGERSDALEAWKQKPSMYNDPELARQQRRIIRELRDVGLGWMADKQAQCGSRAMAFRCETDKCDHVKGMLTSCGLRTCVYCNRRRVAHHLERWLPTIVAMPKPMLLTFTQVDIPGETLRSSRERLMDAWRRAWRAMDMWVKGGIYSWEATEAKPGQKVESRYSEELGRLELLERVSEGNRWHSHLHVIADTAMGYVPLRWMHRVDTPAERDPNKEYTWDIERGQWCETEESFRRSLEGFRVHREDVRYQYITACRVLGRADLKPETREKWEENLHKARRAQMLINSRLTLTDIWYAATYKAAVKAGVKEPKGAYALWYSEVDNSTEKGVTLAAKELLKYCSKPLALSRDGLREAALLICGQNGDDDTPGTHIRTFQAFGSTAKIAAQQEEKSAYTCPCCGSVGSLRCVGGLDKITDSIPDLLHYAVQTPDREKADRMRVLALDRADLVMRILRDNTGGAFPENPIVREFGWGAQAERVREAAIDWGEEVISYAKADAYFGAALHPEDGQG